MVYGFYTQFDSSTSLVIVFVYGDSHVDVLQSLLLLLLNPHVFILPCTIPFVLLWNHLSLYKLFRILFLLPYLNTSTHNDKSPNIIFQMVSNLCVPIELGVNKYSELSPVFFSPKLNQIFFLIFGNIQLNRNETLTKLFKILILEQNRLFFLHECFENLCKVWKQYPTICIYAAESYSCYPICTNIFTLYNKRCIE